ncbi:MAG: IS200/IS605 family transposase [Deltaproteobacteria bacterium]|nr:IS200/IS605 family transposase [Deltaproteobacteria bacterium]
MPQSLARILVHIIFSTKDRLPFIQPAIEGGLFAYMATVHRECGCPALLINGTEDHVHILCSLSRTMAVCDLVEEVKKRSSKWVKTQGAAYAKFSWQGGYGVFSIGESGVEQARRYIEQQKEHHRKKSFQEEYREFLERYRVDFDERYVWG